MWWFAASHANLLLLHRRMTGSAAARKPLLDAGCGTGGLLSRLAAAYPGRIAIGLDADSAACARAAAKSRRPVCAGSVNALPFADAAFGAIVSADVLCHRDADERAALAEFHRCLWDDGVLILNLPAYRWMLSRHDAAVYNVRRYTRRGIARLLDAAGFRLLFAGYWNIVLFPIMVLTRKLLPSRQSAISDVRLYSAPAEALCRAGSSFTNWVAGFVLDKPSGLYLSSFRCMTAFVAGEVGRYDGPFPYVDGLILQVTQDIDRLLVRHLPRAVGRSNYTMRRLLRLWPSMFVNFSVMPLRLSTLTGFALSLLGVIGGIVTVTQALFFDPPAGWASLMAAVLLLSGVQLVILGIIGEYLGRLYLTANKKPQSVIRAAPTAAEPNRPALRSLPLPDPPALAGEGEEWVLDRA